MSEPLDAIVWTPPKATLRPAAAVILVRGAGAAAREVFWVRRSEGLRFSGGFRAFPGGKVDPGDACIELSGVPEDDRAHRVAAIRETFEEAGLLLARGAATMPRARRARLRQELLDGADFATLVAREGLTLDGERLVPAGRWVTPPFSPIRFDARFYLVEVAADEEAEVLPGELADGGWVRPLEALAQWEQGAALLHPPTWHALATLAGHPSEAAVPRLRRVPFLGEDHVTERIEFQRGVILCPMRTETLPPATHTNAYLLGTGELLLVDPGSPDPAEQGRVERLVRELTDEGRRLRAIVLTHAHRDHVGGAAALSARLGVPVWAHARVAARVPGVEPRLVDGQVIELGGPHPTRWQVLLTEGHADGHVALLEEASRAVVAGDLVAGGSTIVIDPPEGDMGVYLGSLRRLLGLGVAALYPAHGMAIPDGPSLLRYYLEHREARMDALVEAVASGVGELRPLVEKVYADTPAFLWPAADRSALASLIELARRGRVVEREPGRWSVG